MAEFAIGVIGLTGSIDLCIKYVSRTIRPSISLMIIRANQI